MECLILFTPTFLISSKLNSNSIFITHLVTDKVEEHGLVAYPVTWVTVSQITYYNTGSKINKLFQFQWTS